MALIRGNHVYGCSPNTQAKEGSQQALPTSLGTLVVVMMFATRRRNVGLDAPTCLFSCVVTTPTKCSNADVPSLHRCTWEDNSDSPPQAAPLKQNRAGGAGARGGPYVSEEEALC